MNVEPQEEEEEVNDELANIDPNMLPKGYEPDKNEKIRAEVIKEIFLTEKDYVKDLHIIYEVN